MSDAERTIETPWRECCPSHYGDDHRPDCLGRSGTTSDREWNPSKAGPLLRAYRQKEKLEGVWFSDGS